jgi:uncharacterized protein YecA (UPF0149 family)
VEEIKGYLRTLATDHNKVVTTEDVAEIASRVIQQVEQISPMIRLSESEQQRFDELHGIAPSAHRLKVGRNAQCPCGSGKKFKRCCTNSPSAPPSITEDEELI